MPSTNLDDLRRLREQALAAGAGSGAWIKAAQALMDAFPSIYETAKHMIGDAELLRWMLRQDRLLIERWHHPGGVESSSVYTALDDDDDPSGRAPTARAAVLMAKAHQDGL